MPAKDDKRFYNLLDSIASTTADEDAVAQNKRIKEAEFAEDSREPTAGEEVALKAYVLKERRQEAEARRLKDGVTNSERENTAGKTIDAEDKITEKRDGFSTTKRS